MIIIIVFKVISVMESFLLTLRIKFNSKGANDPKIWRIVA